MSISWYKQGTWDLKYVLVFSNAQSFERGLPIYSRFMEEPHRLGIVALTK